ncbi:MAG: AraC family transcriptional regulator [Sphaerochaetaceae bacterium]|nr:AraC family transcriptional regulator [Sphaerochaetaceae bacterium]MDC7247004.1 AraC family transcriptional regulator [Sphaerochaetaceae bacterium]
MDVKQILSHYTVFSYDKMIRVTDETIRKTFKGGINFSEKGEELKLVPFIQEESGPREIENHTHHFLELVLILDGECEHIMDKKVFHVVKGDIFFINNKVSHAFNIPKGKTLTLLNYCFLPEYLTKTITLDKLNEGIQFTLVEPFFRVEDNFMFRLHLEGDAFYRVLHLALASVDAFNRSYPKQNELVPLLFKALMIRIYQLYNESGIQKLAVLKRREKIIRELLDTIEKNYLEDISVEDIIEPTGLGRTRANDLFKSIEGETIKQFINRRRIEQASQLLAQSNLDILTVALDSGFNDLSYFNRIFKRTTGMTPSEFRKSGKKYKKS